MSGKDSNLYMPVTELHKILNEIYFFFSPEANMLRENRLQI